MNNSDMKGKVVSGVFWKFGERILAQGISFLVSIVLARILLPSDYGVVALVTIFITIANVFITSGFNTALIQKKDADETDFSTIFYCSLTVSIILYIVIFFCAPLVASFYNMPLLTLVLRVFALKLPLAAYNSIQHAYVSRHMIFKRFFYSTLFGTLLSGVVGIILAYFGLGVWALIAQYMTNSIVDILILNFTVPWRPKLLFSKKSAKNLMGYGWKVLASSLIGTIFNELRSLIIGKMYLPADLAYYNKGNQIPTLISNNISATIMTVLFPAISNVSNEPSRVKGMVSRAIRVTSYVVFPLMAGCIAVAGPFIELLLTSKWNDCAIYMQMFSVSAALAIISEVSLQSIKAIGRSDVLLKLEFIKKPIYFVLLIVGAYFSVFGIAVTSVIYAFIANAINALYLKKLLKYSFKEQLSDLFAPFILSIVMIASIYFFNFLPIADIFKLIIQFIIGITVYIGLSYLFKVDSFIYIVNYIKTNVHFKSKKGDKNNG